MNSTSDTGKKSRTSAVAVRITPEPRILFGIVAKRTYRIVNGRCIAADEQEALVEEPVLNDAGDFVRDSDLILQREYTDIILEGTVYAYEPSYTVRMSLSIGELEKHIEVYGDRTLDHRNGTSVQFSMPAQFEQIPINWSNSYGGVDLGALEELGDPTLEISEMLELDAGPEQSLFAYPRNPKGKGYILERNIKSIEQCRLPNFEYPEERLSPENLFINDFLNWPLAPQPVGLGWLPFNYFPRMAQLGMTPLMYQYSDIFPNHFHEVKSGVLNPRCLNIDLPIPKRTDIGMVQSAAVGMRTKYISANEAIQLTHCHPKDKTWTWRLPGEIPQIAVKIPDAPPFELIPRIKLLQIKPDKDTVCVVWVAEDILQVPLSEQQLNEIQHGVIWQK